MVIMFFTVYRTTNKVNGKYYFGVHKTENPMDSYLGSGKHLKRAIAKYGESNFAKEILLSSCSPDVAFVLEHELIEKHRGDPLCYNLRQGGSGGFDYINRVGLNGNAFKTKECRQRGAETHRKRFETDPEYRRMRIENLNKIRPLMSAEKREQYRQKAIAKWKGGHQTLENRRKFSEMRIGDGNPNFGLRWIHKDQAILRVKVEELQDWMDKGWRRGKNDKNGKRWTKGSNGKPGPKPLIYDATPEGKAWCSIHKEYLSVEQFHRDKNRKNGYKAHCIECRKKKRKGKKW